MAVFFEIGPKQAPKQNPVDDFAWAMARITKVLESLQKITADHFGTSPDEITAGLAEEAINIASSLEANLFAACSLEALLNDARQLAVE